MSVRVSTRKSIRWLPDAPSEPTDTLVMTMGSEGYYVDLRVSKEDGSIDWALAGQAIRIKEDPMTIEFTHPLDSHLQYEHDEPKPDVGTFSVLPDGDELEVGEMAAPHLGGKITPYEEVWHELDSGIHSWPGKLGCPPSWILESFDDKSSDFKSYYGRAGIYFLALRQTKKKGQDDGLLVFSALRQEFDLDTGIWNTKYSIGDTENLLNMKDADKHGGVGGSWSAGDKVHPGRHSELCVVRALVQAKDKQ